MKRIFPASFVLIVTLLLISTALAQTPTIPLEGLDAVELCQGKEVSGNMKIFVNRGPYRYIFANEANKAKFEREPQRYEIQLGGTCVKMGASTSGNADIYTAYQGKIYVFTTGDCLKAFLAAPERYIPPDFVPTASASAEALKKGRDLIEQAVAAMGGAAKLDGLTSYQESATVVENIRGKEVQAKNVLLFAFPDRIRQQRLYFGTPVAAIITPTEGFLSLLSRPATLPMSNYQMQDERKKFNRKLVALLRARNNADFKAISLGSGKVGDMAVEQVRVEFGGQAVTLGLDPQGRVLSNAYRDRGPDSTFGDLVEQYADYRAVDGLMLPFKTTTTFNGKPVSNLSLTFDSIVINAPIAPDAFEKPKPKQPDKTRE